MSFYFEVSLSNLGVIDKAELSGGAFRIELPSGDWLVGALKLNSGICEKKFKKELYLLDIDQDAMFDFLCKFSYQFSVMFFKRKMRKLHILKDLSGCESAYYKLTKDKLIFSSGVNLIADNDNGLKLSETGVFEFVYLEMPWKPASLYEDVYSVLNGVIYSYDAAKNSFSISDRFNLHEITEQQDTSPKELREKITEAHEKRLGNNNAIFLSGGVDSQVMSVALRKDLGIKDLVAFNFSVIGAENSEQAEAKQTAIELGIDFVPVEVDPNKKISLEDLVLNQNSPYIGSFYLSEIFGHCSTTNKLTFFGGQDTRLHTPALTKEDLAYWKLASLPLGTDAMRFGSKLMTAILNSSKYSQPGDKKQRLHNLFMNIGKPEGFLALRHFHIHDYPFIHESIAGFEPIGELKEELSKVSFRRPRSLYNKIVELNWRKQYLFDIEYMIGVTRSHGHECVMPFYDRELTEYSASLNFNLATKFTSGRAGHSSKKVSVNKFILRKAYEKELKDELIFRDKAVCPTNYMYFNGALCDDLKSFIHSNPLLGTQLGEFLNIKDLMKIAHEKQGRWKPGDNSLSVTIFNAMVCCKLIEKHKIELIPL
jgi:hypothetical protein